MNGDDHVQVRTLWVSGEDIPATMSNQFLGQVEQDDIIVTFGQLLPPALTAATPEERKAQALALGYIPIKTLARISLTRKRAQELRDVLQSTIDMYDAGHGGTP